MNKVIIGDKKWEKEEEIELKEVNYGGKDMRWFIGDTEFDGHHFLWGFEYFPTTYLKSSSLSGDEYRKGGEIRIFRNRKQVYSEFCRETHNAILRIGKLMLDLEGLDFEKIKTGEKIYWRDTPAIISNIMWEQGTMMVEVAEPAENFPEAIWAKEECEKLEDKKEVKVSFLDPNIWWFRD